MTVCIAALFQWTYAPGDTGLVALTTSDRMITAGDIEYEPPQFKTSFLSQHIHIMVSGDYGSHSEALMMLHVAAKENSSIDAHAAALLYADSLQKLRLREATRAILAPLGMTTTDFLERQGQMAPSLVTDLFNQMQAFRGPPTEAIIVGSSGQRSDIYLIDQSGALSCQSDVGFAAIGIGAWHAKPTIMRAGYGKHIPYATALSISYAAKKSALVAPGVGSTTDMFLITRDGWSQVEAALVHQLETAYEIYEAGVRNLAKDAMDSVNERLRTLDITNGPKHDTK